MLVQAVQDRRVTMNAQRHKDLKLPSKKTHPDAIMISLAEYGVPSVLQLGKCRVGVTRDSARGQHSHDCLQITFCTRGSMTFTDDRGKMWSLLPGNMLVLPPNTVHRLLVNTRGNERYWLFLPKSAGGCNVMSGLPAEESAWLSSRLRSLDARIYKVPDGVIALLSKTFDVLGDGGRSFAEKSVRLRSVMLRLLVAIVDAEPCEAVDDGVVHPIVEKMALYHEKRYSMDSLVSETGLSPTTIRNLFRRETGKSPLQYLMGCRIRKGEKLLASTNRTVTEIALSLGFASSQHFAAYFHRENGITPRHWRDKAKKK